MDQSNDIRGALLAAHERFGRAIAGRDAAALESAPVVGSWAVRDVAAHLTDWVDALRLSAEAALNGGAAPEPIADGEAFNLAAAARRADSPWPAVWAELDEAMTHAANLAGRLTPAQLDQSATYPWDEPGTVRGLLEAIVAHHDEHSEQVG